MSELCSDF